MRSRQKRSQTAATLSADQFGLLQFVESIPRWPEKIILAHGASVAVSALAAALELRAAAGVAHGGSTSLANVPIVWSPMSDFLL